MDYSEAKRGLAIQVSKAMDCVNSLSGDLGRLKRIRAGLEEPRGQAFAAANLETIEAVADHYRHYVTAVECAGHEVDAQLTKIGDYSASGGESQESQGYGLLGIGLVVGLVSLLAVAAASIARSVARVKEAETEQQELELLEQGILEPFPWKTLIFSGVAVLLLGGGEIFRRRRKKRQAS